MKLLLPIAFLFTLAVALWTSAAQVASPPPRPLAELVPGGPLLYLEAKDLSGLVRGWNGSPEKKLWLESDNFEVFSRSHLYLRLKQAHEEFAQAAGISPDMALVEGIAGNESALAIYDIGELHFLYVTHLGSAHALDSVLWRTRAKYEPRNAAGLPYYVRLDSSKKRVAAFTAANDYLLLATREELIAGALALIARQPGTAVSAERWFEQPVRAAAQKGDLRLVMNLEALVRTPHFRSYWLQRNVSDLRPFSSGIVDAQLSSVEVREQRAFLRAEPGTPPASESLGQVLRLVSGDAGLYRAWTAPGVNAALDLLERKVLAPRSGSPPPGRNAPTISLSDGVQGSEGDLEVRIDEPPLGDVRGALESGSLRKLLEAAKLEALLQVQSSRALPGDVLVGNQSAVVLMAGSDWNGPAVRDALREAVESLWTTTRLGANWVERKRGAFAYSELDGLARITVATEGHFLIVADGTEPLTAILDSLSATATPAQNLVYAAGFRHARERDPFTRMMRLMDAPGFQTNPGPGRREPHFFSENVASLSRVLTRVQSATIAVQDTGTSLAQTVIYRLNP